MKKVFKYTMYFAMSIFYFFSADIVALFNAPPFIDKGFVSNALRLPVAGGAFIIFVLTVAQIYKIENRLPVIISGIVGAGTLSTMILSSSSIGTNINIFQILWYGISGLTLAIVTCISLLISIGVIKEKHLKHLT